MSRRLQVILSDEEDRRFRRAAERKGVSLSEWVRRALRREERRLQGPAAEEILQALDRALGCHHPTGDIDQMLRKIESGRDLR